MAQRPDIQYVTQFYTYGSEAKVLELKPARKQQKMPLPKAKPMQKIRVVVDPVAWCGIALALVLVVLMVFMPTITVVMMMVLVTTATMLVVVIMLFMSTAAVVVVMFFPLCDPGIGFDTADNGLQPGQQTVRILCGDP